MIRKQLVLPIALAVFVAACQPGQSDDPKSDIEHLNLPGIAESGLPFSSAVRAGDTLYLSGVIGTIPGTLQVPESIEEEARLAMEQIKDALESFGSSLDRVVKCTVFMADESHRDAFNRVYMSYFDKLPARSGVTVKGLALGAKAEVECIALVN
ncbi:MAG: RidA family protein [Woeseiaceae bacterium]|nr:RidA family protein [Woeseiaceae bacterium]